ncbi:hypothetical protein BG015_010086 [Linnemannia schmuckeri]|uniref:Uncharacterized protein n=1 Tax=Linnemannia schmuckeri TaxID=64567 RepID=A0A9P5RUL1_9FUNG|nr:hypothetical protein BG015_010086 [Linnemannia schmuckeri]
MRLAILCLGIVTLFTATVLAQEIIAPEEWFQSMKVAQGLVARHDKRHQSRRHRTANSRHHHMSSISKSKRNNIVLSSPNLEERRWDYPTRREIEQRATAFNTFRADAIVASSANLHIVKEPMVGSGGKPAKVAKMEKAGKAAKELGKKVTAKAKQAAGKGDNKHEKRS